jgi:hypothetical protein
MFQINNMKYLHVLFKIFVMCFHVGQSKLAILP